MTTTLRGQLGQTRFVLDVPALLDELSTSRPVFHSEADFQHALAWTIQLHYPEARLRLETRPERGIHLDVLVVTDGHRCAIELKYLADRVDITIDGESFDVPRRAAHDISRYDVCKDLWRVETMIADGYADSGWVVALSSDGGYWRPGTKADPIDKAFRIFEGCGLTGERAWDGRAGSGTTRGRESPITLRGRYECRWRSYSTIQRSSGKPIELRYLALPVTS